MSFHNFCKHRIAYFLCETKDVKYDNNYDETDKKNLCYEILMPYKRNRKQLSEKPSVIKVLYILWTLPKQ